MNVVFCLLVVFIHTSSVAVSGLDKSSWQYGILIVAWRLASVAVYGFLFLGGLKFALSSNREGFSYKRYYCSRIKRVVLPYLIAAAVYLAFFTVFDLYSFTPVNFVKDLLFGTLTAHFYFIIIILQFYLLAPLWRWLMKRFCHGEWVAAVLLLSYLAMQAFGHSADSLLSLVGIIPDRSVTTVSFLSYLPYWVGGLAVGTHYESVVRSAKQSFRSVGLLFLLAAFCEGLFSWLHFSGRAAIYWLEQIHSFYVIVAVLFAFVLAVGIGDGKLAHNPLVRLLDHSSFSIYLWHVLVLYGVDYLLQQWGVADQGLHFFCRTAFTFLVTCGGCMSFTWLAHRIRKQG